MTALDALLDARVSDSEIALWLEISEHAVRLRRISREREAIRSSRRPVLTLHSESACALSVSGKTHSQPLTLGSVTP